MSSRNKSDFRPLHPGMGEAVAQRTVLRKLDPETRKELPKDAPKGSAFVWENWGEVADRVALGNSLLSPDHSEHKREHAAMRNAIANGSLLMSGRHLQHGDRNQPQKCQEMFTNCLHRSTKILTLEHGPVEIGTIAGLTVTVKARDGQWRSANVKSYGIQQLFRYDFTAVTGPRDLIKQSVVATANHRWFLEDGSVTTELKIDDRLEPAHSEVHRDDEAVRHGLIYGDGTAHKSRIDYSKQHVSQGRTYASIRLCGNDKKYLNLFDGYNVSYPPHANGDPVVYVGKKPFWKELPFTTDPEYISGFIHGWWLADGSKTFNSGQENRIEISTTNEIAVEWLKNYSSYAGYVIAGISIKPRTENDGSFFNGKTLYCVRLSRNVSRKVVAITPELADEVFCVEEPVTTGFVLANGLLTGNCATSSSSFVLFLLLLNGAGVGRCYDDELILVNWDNAPTLRCVLDTNHADFDWSAHESVRDAKHKYGNGRDVLWHEVEDSREGWSKALEVWENAAFEKIHKDKMLILDFSKVRCKGSPIGGMQNRPASGPVPLMNAFMKAASLKGSGLAPWKQAMYIDHYMAECVLVGGARRAARIATKFWKDPSVLDFIQIKRPIEFYGRSIEEILGIRRAGRKDPYLWSANNSVTVDKEFWDLLDLKRGSDDYMSDDAKHARKVWKMITECSYADGTGEPGIINADRLSENNEGIDALISNGYVGSRKYQVNEDTELYLKRLARKTKKLKYAMITNPCGEINLHVLGGFCVIADLAPFHCESLADVVETARIATRALIRVNLMDSIYNAEVKRTNRIGVSLTGVHEFAWKFFGYGFRDLLDEEKSKDFWLFLNSVNKAIREESISYSIKLGVVPPHTCMTIKPAGSTSKLFGLTEGWHLPSMAQYLRWVQFRNDDPLIAQYKANGYPVRELKTYEGTTIVGFPTITTLGSLGLGDKLVTAGEATPEEQYKWLSLGEKYWIDGLDETGQPRRRQYGSQISYTLKYNPQVVSYEEFRDMMLKYQRQIKCCSVMPQTDTSSYEYLPETPISKAEYEAMAYAIQITMEEDLGREHLDCGTGGCPIDFDEDDKEQSKK